MKHEVIRELHNMSHATEELLKSVKDAFIHEDHGSLEKANILSKEIHKKEKELTPKLVELSKEHDIKEYLAIPGHLERIGDFIENLMSCIKTKERESLLFSDKAVNEINILINDAERLLNNISDLILSKNTTLAGDIKKEVTELVEKANDFATEHEERLIEGLCQPKSSSVFLSMLDAIKEIALHSQRIAERLS